MEEKENIYPFESTMEAVKRFAEQYKPEISYSLSVADRFPEMAKNLQTIAKTFMPAVDFTKQISEIFEPLLDKLSELVKSVKKLSKPFSVMEKLADSQYVYWKFDSDMMDYVLNNENTNKALRLYHEKEKYASVFETANKCINCPALKANKKLLEQAVDAFKSGNLELAIVGLTATIDGSLELIPNNPKASIYLRAKKLLDKIENEEVLDSHETSLIILLTTFESTLKTFTTNSFYFDKTEPKNLNRHWIMHGRSKRRKTKLDCVKLINFLYGIILLDELANSENKGE